MASILIMEDTPEKLQYLRSFSRWLDYGCRPAQGLSGSFKKDGDGSIKNIKYPKSLASFFTVMVDVWVIPSIFPCSQEELIEKIYFLKELFDSMGIPVMDEEILQGSLQQIKHLDRE